MNLGKEPISNNESIVLFGYEDDTYGSIHCAGGFPVPTEKAFKALGQERIDFVVKRINEMYNWKMYMGGTDSSIYNKKMGFGRTLSFADFYKRRIITVFTEGISVFDYKSIPILPKEFDISAHISIGGEYENIGYKEICKNDYAFLKEDVASYVIHVGEALCPELFTAAVSAHWDPK